MAQVWSPSVLQAPLSSRSHSRSLRERQLRPASWSLPTRSPRELSRSWPRRWQPEPRRSLRRRRKQRALSTRCPWTLPAQTPRTPTKAMRASLARRFEVSLPNPLRLLEKMSDCRPWPETARSRPDLTPATLPGCSASGAIEEAMGETPPINDLWSVHASARRIEVAEARVVGRGGPSHARSLRSLR